jgi:hypothetical protein
MNKLTKAATLSAVLLSALVLMSCAPVACTTSDGRPGRTNDAPWNQGSCYPYNR